MGENAVINSDPPSARPLFTYLRVAARLCTFGMVGGIMTVQPRMHHFILRFALVRRPRHDANTNSFPGHHGVHCAGRRRNVGLGSVDCIVNAIDVGDASEPLDSFRVSNVQFELDTLCRTERDCPAANVKSILVTCKVHGFAERVTIRGVREWDRG